MKVDITCPDCGRIKSVTSGYAKKRKSLLCKNCYAKRHILELNNIQRMDRNPNWKGGIFKNGKYIGERLQNNHPRIKMASNNNILQHRLIMAEHLGRDLEPWEIVHHKNGNKHDNRIENLELLTHSNHLQVTKMQQKIIELEQRIIELESMLGEVKHNAINEN